MREFTIRDVSENTSAKTANDPKVNSIMEGVNASFDCLKARNDNLLRDYWKKMNITPK